MVKHVKFPIFDVTYGPKFDLQTLEIIDDRITDNFHNIIPRKDNNEFICSRCGLKIYYERGRFRSHFLINKMAPTCDEYKMHEALG